MFFNVVYFKINVNNIPNNTTRNTKKNNNVKKIRTDFYGKIITYRLFVTTFITIKVGDFR